MSAAGPAGKPHHAFAIATYADLAAHPEAWDELMARAITTHPHYSRHVIGAHVAAGLARADLAFVVVRRGDSLEALLPFRSRRDIVRLGRPVYRPFLSPFITQTSPLVDDGADIDRTLDLLVAGLRAASAGGVWRWPLLPAETRLGRALLGAMDRSGWQYGITGRFERPIVERRPTYADFLSEHPHRSRMKDLRRRRRNLAKRGKLTQGAAIGGADLTDAVASFLSLERAGWKGRAGTAMACAPRTEAFARALFASDGNPVEPRADLLLLDGRPLAISLGLVVGSTATLLKIAYDEAERSSAPGLLLEAQIVAEMHETGFAERLDSAALAGSVLEGIYPDREAICDLVAEPDRAERRLSLAWRLRLARWEADARGRIKRVLRRR